MLTLKAAKHVALMVSVMRDRSVNLIVASKAVVHPNAVPFVGLSANAVRGLRYTFNDQAEGFGVSPTKLCDMCDILSEQLAASENLDLEAKRLNRQVRSLFKVLDTDRNKLVDAIGFLAAVAAISTNTGHSARLRGGPARA